MRQLGYIGVDFGFQRRGQHPPGAFPDDLIQQRAAAWRGAVLGDYRKHGRAFPADGATSALLDDLSIDPSGRYAPFRQADPQVLSIAPRRAKLMSAARDGEPFDPKTGLPASELRALRQRTI
ncbi:hypothetical protein AB0D74_01535 [Streptomyces sp. NPDC048278]|uniref:hypothetical protein n=1 Tax=Streptomyces sp. NPDC048278 TaxID=3155809 RepID=UPI0034443EAA